jgi:hypothetical protein
VRSGARGVAEWRAGARDFEIDAPVARWGAAGGA